MTFNTHTSHEHGPIGRKQVPDFVVGGGRDATIIARETHGFIAKPSDIPQGPKVNTDAIVEQGNQAWADYRAEQSRLALGQTVVDPAPMLRDRKALRSRKRKWFA